jgi:hypothetical protein
MERGKIKKRSGRGNVKEPRVKVRIQPSRTAKDDLFECLKVLAFVDRKHIQICDVVSTRRRHVLVKV